MTDPNIKIARALSFLSKLACVNVPTSAYSAVIDWSSPWLTTPFTWTYRTLGLGNFAKDIADLFGSDDDDGEQRECPAV